MESENVFDALTVYAAANQNLIIAVIYFLAAHYTNIFQILAFVGEFSEALCGDVGAADVNIFQKPELVGNVFGTGIVNFCAA